MTASAGLVDAVDETLAARLRTEACPGLREWIADAAVCRDERVLDVGKSRR